MNFTASKLFKELTNIEAQIQRLKVRAYFALPKKEQQVGAYSDKAISQALRTTRDNIWQKKYAKKVTDIS